MFCTGGLGVEQLGVFDQDVLAVNNQDTDSKIALRSGVPQSATTGRAG